MSDLDDDFVVYKISSSSTSSTYYGYCQGDNALESFIKSSSRQVDPNVRRGGVEWLLENKGDKENIDVDVVDVCTDELEAWCVRNDSRTSDVFSITGFSPWPAKIAERANQDHPERVGKWKANKKINDCSSARKAMKLGAFTFAQMKELGKTHDQSQVKTDMDKLNPKQFSEKYDLQISYT